MGKGGKYINTSGYVMVHVGKKVSSNGYVPEHVLVMEKHLGRKLVKGEIPHHIDETFEARSNNKEDNLQLTNRPEHQNHHKPRLGTGKGYEICFHIRNFKWQLRVHNKIEGKWRGAGMYKTKEDALKVVEEKYGLKVGRNESR